MLVYQWTLLLVIYYRTSSATSSTPCRRSVGRPTHTHAARRSPIRLRNEPSLFITGQSVQQHSQVILIISLVTSPHSVTSFVLISSPHPAGSSVNHGCVFGTGIPTLYRRIRVNSLMRSASEQRSSDEYTLCIEVS